VDGRVGCLFPAHAVSATPFGWMAIRASYIRAISLARRSCFCADIVGVVALGLQGFSETQKAQMAQMIPEMIAAALAGWSRAAPPAAAAAAAAAAPPAAQAAQVTAAARVSSHSCCSVPLAVHGRLWRPEAGAGWVAWVDMGRTGVLSLLHHLTAAAPFSGPP
jgi:hypothetical protein